MNTLRLMQLCSLATIAALTSVGCESLCEFNSSDSLIILQQRDSGETVGAAMTHADSERTCTFRITGGDYDGMLVHRETTATNRFNATWLTVESVITADGPIPRRSEYWSINDAGDAVLHATVDHDERAITLFKPPLVTMPAELKPGETQHYKSNVRIVAEDDVRRRKESGTATQVIAHVGSVRMRTARGEVEATKIMIDFEADLAMADAIEKTVRYVATDTGVVAITRTRQVNILGFAGSEHTEMLQRTVQSKQLRLFSGGACPAIR